MTPAAGSAPAASCHGVAPAGLPERPALPGSRLIALVGAPNVGKSTLFNLLTGARRETGNWPGTSVAVGQGEWRGLGGRAGGDPGPATTLIDLPGAYSLDPLSPDEQLTRDLLVTVPAGQRPDLVVIVLDATNLPRSLYLLAQLREHPIPVVAALTMTDVAQRRGLQLRLPHLAEATAVPVVAVDPRRGTGVPALEAAVRDLLAGRPEPQPAEPHPAERQPAELHPAERQLTQPQLTEPQLTQPQLTEPQPAGAGCHCCSSGPDPAPAGADQDLAAADERFAWIDGVLAAAVTRGPHRAATSSDRIDRVATSPVLGPVVFLAVMWLTFQITTTLAAPLQRALSQLLSGPVTDALRWALGRVHLADSPVGRFLIDGVLAGVGMLLTFVPLMILMFGLLSVLEDSGYLARAAVVTDRVMRWLGLPGRAFLPLVIGFGCNVPGVAATRVLPDARHRLLTTLLVPYTSCSARLTVYVMVAGIFFPGEQGSVVFLLYLVSILLVVAVGLALRLTVLRRIPVEPLVIDLPPYHLPVPRLAWRATWTRVRGFLRTASGIIVATVAVVWLLQAIPAGAAGGSTAGAAGAGDAGAGPGFGRVSVQDSLFGAVARTAAPVFAPAGFGDWHAASALATGFVAKEAVVSSWSQTYAAQQDAAGTGAVDLRAPIRADFAASSGGHSTAAVWAFLVFLLAYTPCVATIAAQRREIGWRRTLAGAALQLTVAYALAVTVFQLGRLL